MNKTFIKYFEDVGIEDINEVGGKNASLGEMIQNISPKGVNIPGGYIVTASAYHYFLSQTGLLEFITNTLKGLNTKDLPDLSKKAKAIREKIKKTDFPRDLQEAIISAQKAIEKKFGKKTDFAVRSSATAEDLPGASFAGEHETYLNVCGTNNILKAVREAMASLFTDRAISYRAHRGFDHLKIALSVGIQEMVRSDQGCSGIIFTLDTESGFPNVVLIHGSWGLGELIVQGEVIPDEFLIFKENLGKDFVPIIEKKLGVKNQKMVYGDRTPTRIVGTSQKERASFILTDREILQLALWSVEIEKHYTKRAGKWTPMDLEWAKDGKTGKLYIIQARPETIHANRDFSKILTYKRLEDGKEIVRGASVGSKIAVGCARVIVSPSKIGQFQKDEILVTEATDPDWEPIMKMASAIVTDSGGRTSHAAIVSREMGIPAVVGCKEATEKIETGDKITVDTTGNDGVVYEGILKFEILEQTTKKIPKTKTKIMLNIATPGTAFEKSFLPNDGVGLLREEFIIASEIGVHPMAVINYTKLPKALKSQIDEKSFGYLDKKQFYADKLAFGIAKIAAAFYPKPVIVRFSDFKTNEYQTLIGGELYEMEEENPMIGFRGASRYCNPDFLLAFLLEIEAIKKVRDEMGLSNVCLMIPFCRTVEEGEKVIKILKENGLEHGKDGLKIYVMCEIPSNVILADDFLQIFDGMSIGSNDLTQLTLGIDRDGNELIRSISNENDKSVKKLISQVIETCKTKGKYIGICGQAPSDYPEFAKFLVHEGIESISLNPDSVI
ncbi:phosphoenolpyruvate synthase, partial [Patescibacteria group bacterium]|nr:phosphoenolpyruvate synthase [Patescibacteria group bacterium]